ncbi:MAG: hypothetical protein ACRD1N_06955 [Terriglobia bacterium]
MRTLCVVLVVTLLGGAAALRAQQKASLSPAEVEKLRDTQDPSGRIELYLELMQTRLSAFGQLRAAPTAAPAKMGTILNTLLAQYVSLDDEMKNWIQYQYNRDGDMRKGLHALLDEAPKQLAILRQARQSPAAYTNSGAYSDNLDNAMADLQDTLDGATKALSDQEKKLGQLKREEKKTASTSKSAIKEEKKRIKEEEKLRKKEGKQEQSH